MSSINNLSISYHDNLMVHCRYRAHPYLACSVKGKINDVGSTGDAKPGRGLGGSDLTGRGSGDAHEGRCLALAGRRLPAGAAARTRRPQDDGAPCHCARRGAAAGQGPGPKAQPCGGSAATRQIEAAGLRGGWAAAGQIAAAYCGAAPGPPPPPSRSKDAAPLAAGPDAGGRREGPGRARRPGLLAPSCCPCCAPPCGDWVGASRSDSVEKRRRPCIRYRVKSEQIPTEAVPCILHM